MPKLPKYERTGKVKQKSGYRSKILDVVPKRIGIPEEFITLEAGVCRLNYKHRLLIEFEATGGNAIEIRSFVTNRLLMAPSRIKFLRDTEEIIEKAMRRLQGEERE